MRMRVVTDDERRARLATRHAISPTARVVNPVAATRAMTVLHATEPATVYLSLQARVEGLSVADVDRALYDERSLVKQLAMRRTLFVFPRDLLPAAWGSASARVATALRARLAKEVELSGLSPDGAAWLDAACAAVLARLADGGELDAQTLREQVPELAGRMGTVNGATASVAPRVLTQLAAETLLVRGRNGGHWRTSRPRWTLMAGWLGEEPAPWSPGPGYAELVRRWLCTFGPGTEADLVWWLGSTKAAVRQALTDVAAVQVALEGGGVGWVLPEDEEPVPAADEPWAALLPVLDATTMGWRDRDFYLDPHHTPYLFDSNGNGGTTAWWNGRIVGCWVQDDAGVVHVVPSESLAADARAALAVEAARLTEWVAGVRIGTVYPSLQMKSAVLP